MLMNKVLFSFKSEAVPSNKSTLPNKAELFEKLRERDLEPVVSLQGEAAFDEQGVQTHELMGEADTRALGHTGLEKVGLIVNRLDRMFRVNESTGKNGQPLPYLPEAWQAAGVPKINENAMRSLAFRKERVQREIFEPLGLGMPTQLIENSIDAIVFAYENPAEEYVIKPNSGSGGKGVVTVSATELARESSALTDGASMIIQPKYDFSRGMHPALRPYDAMSAEAFDAWSKSDVMKELRTYVNLSPTKLTMLTVGRAIKDDIDYWFFVDQDSVPQEVFDDAESAVRLAAQETNSPAITAAIDSGYGSLNGEAPAHHIIEFNGRMPYLMGYDKHAGVADKLRENYADQIADTIAHR